MTQLLFMDIEKEDDGKEQMKGPAPYRTFHFTTTTDDKLHGGVNVERS